MVGKVRRRKPRAEKAMSSEEVVALKSRIAELERAQPKFVKMEREPRNPRARTYAPPENLVKQVMKGLAKGQETQGTVRWLDTQQGRQTIPPDYRPLFGPGDLVRLNPEAPVWQMEGKTCGDLLGNPALKSDGIGEIVGTMYMTETWEPKYKVKIGGITKGSGAGFRESELLPYDG